MHCDLLIHEATFEDALVDEAVKKRHSTISEACTVAHEMKCKNFIMTHFSQRYPTIPQFESPSSSGSTDSPSCSIYAFDGMRVPFVYLNKDLESAFQKLRPILSYLRDTWSATTS